MAVKKYPFNTYISSKYCCILYIYLIIVFYQM